MKAKIRLCKLSDLPRVHRLIDSWVSEFKGGPAKGENWFSRKNIRSLVKENPKTCWVLEIGGKIEGFRFAEKTYDGRVWAWTLFMSKDFRDKGYGTKFFKETAKRLRKLGFRKMYAECDYDNRRAIAWHKKVGYKRIATFPDWFGQGAHAVIFAYDLK